MWDGFLQHGPRSFWKLKRSSGELSRHVQQAKRVPTWTENNMDSFFSCKYAVASNPIRIRLIFSGHKFTIIYSRLDVINKTGKIHLIHMVSHNYCIPLYHPTLFPSFFTAFHHPKKFNLIATKILNVDSTILQQPTKKVVILDSAWGNCLQVWSSQPLFTWLRTWSLWQRFHAQPAAAHLRRFPGWWYT